MSRIYIKELYRDYLSLDNVSVEVCGWVRTIRDAKNIAFIELNDGSFFKNAQVVVNSDINNYSDLISQNAGAGLRIFGKVKLTPEMKQPFEITCESYIIEGTSTPNYPLQKKRHSVEFLREIAHLRPRTNLFLATFRVRSVAAQAIHRFFGDNNFAYVHTPIITGSDCEGAGEMFRVTTLDLDNIPHTDNGLVDYSKDFFGKSASLTVSGQLNAECLALALGNVYTFGPTFRAEKSFTVKHAAEFWMIEPEIAFSDLKDDMKLARDMMKYVIKYVLDHCREEMEFFNGFIDKGLIERLTNLVDAEFKEITYTDAVAILEKVNDKFQYKVSWGCDLQTEHERYLTEQVFNAPVFVTNYPKDIKAFYMRMNDDNKTVAAVDLLVPGVGEIIGGSQREERYDLLVKRIKEMGLNEEDYSWYLDLRRYGGVKHAGFGMGFDRLIMYITGVSNIRDVLPFSRTTGNADF